MPFPLGNLQLESLTGPHPNMTPDEAKNWQKYKMLVRDFAWVSKDQRMKVVVRAGRFVDGASVPGFLGLLWWICGQPFGPLAICGTIHDELYRDGTNQGVADYTLGAVARETPAIKRYQRILVVAGLRLGGWYTWRKYRGTLPWSKVSRCNGK